MGAEVVGMVGDTARRVARNLPEAHARWEFWKKALFRRAVRDYVGLIRNVEQDILDDSVCDFLTQSIEVVLNVIAVHTAGLNQNDTRDHVDIDYFALVVTELREAISGLEMGLAPSPSKRPTRAQLLDEFAEFLSGNRFNLPDRTDCAQRDTA